MTKQEKAFDEILDGIIEETEETAAIAKPNLKELRKQIDILCEKRDEKLKNFDYAKCSSFRDWQECMEPEQTQINDLVREYRLIQIPEYEDIPDYGDVMTFDVFKDFCNSGGFIDYDGSGNYATTDKMTDIGISPSDITEGKYRTDFTHVVWFNK